MLACMAKGKAHAEEDEEQGHRRGTSLYCKLSVQDVRAALDVQAKKAMQTPDTNKNSQEGMMTTSQRVFATAEVALKLAAETASVCRALVSTDLQPLRRHCRLPENASKKAPDCADTAHKPASVNTETHDWQEAYAKWCIKTYVPETEMRKIIPNEKQRQVLETLHSTCVDEEGHKHCEAARNVPSPLRHSYSWPTRIGEVGIVALVPQLFRRGVEMDVRRGILLSSTAEFNGQQHWTQHCALLGSNWLQRSTRCAHRSKNGRK